MVLKNNSHRGKSAEQGASHHLQSTLAAEEAIEMIDGSSSASTVVPICLLLLWHYAFHSFRQTHQNREKYTKDRYHL